MTLCAVCLRVCVCGEGCERYLEEAIGVGALVEDWFRGLYIKTKLVTQRASCGEIWRIFTQEAYWNELGGPVNMLWGFFLSFFLSFPVSNLGVSGSEDATIDSGDELQE